MATIPPINYGALKVTFPANLPRNEKDLICMLLAGRLKDLWRGRLVCAQLAIDDLIKDLTGVSALGNLRAQLIKLKGSLDGFKNASGYDRILGGVNRAMGQVGVVFSLGGLCPSPVTPPRIPDILAKINQNLFGQANNILNALAQASNPRFCLGGGPKGFGLDWSKVTGDLKLLKNSIADFKRDPGNANRIIQAFESNLNSQTKRLNSELKRLEKNLTDPLGLAEKRNTAAAVQRAKAISDGYPVKDKNGITYKNASRSMIPGEVDGVLSRLGANFTSPVKYVTKPVFDYCGELTGYTRELVTGDPDYLGYDTLFEELNVATPTTNPTGSFKDYDFFFKEENGNMSVYNTEGQLQGDLNLQRGQHYRIGIQITSNLNFGIYNVDDSFWGKGITLTQEPEFGKGFEITTFREPCNSLAVEIDWAVAIENPTTPDLLVWKTNTGQQGNIIIGGPTTIPQEDKSYDINNAVRKSLMFVNSQEYANGDIALWEEQIDTASVYTSTATATGTVNFSANSTLSYNAGYSTIDDTETLDAAGDVIEGNKILKFVQPYGDNYIVSKLYYNEVNGLDINQFSSFITSNLADEEQGYQLLASLRFLTPVEFLNDTKLPFSDYTDYMLTLADETKLTNTEQSTVELINSSTIAVHLSSNRNSLPSSGEFILSFEIAVDPADADRSYQKTNPKLNKFTAQFKGINFNFEQTLVRNI